MMNATLLQFGIISSIVSHDKCFDSIWWIIQYPIDALIVTAAGAGTGAAAIRSGTVCRVIGIRGATIIRD